MEQQTAQIRLLLVSGNQCDLVIPIDQQAQTPTIRNIKEKIFNEWPSEWQGEYRGLCPDDLRIVYQGKFLEDSLPLINIIIDISKDEITTLHLLPRPNVGNSSKDKKNKNSSCCSCTIM